MNQPGDEAHMSFGFVWFVVPSVSEDKGLPGCREVTVPCQGNIGSALDCYKGLDTQEICSTSS